MGSTGTRSMLEHATNEDAVLEWHMRSNHYPPLPRCLIQVAKDVIRALRDDAPEELIQLPDGIEHKEYGREVPAHVCADSWHLWEFAERDADEVE